MKKIKIILAIALLHGMLTNAISQYKFTDEIKLPSTSVKNQQHTGTCWSFSTSSFLESEIIRMGKEPVNLSEMYNARMAYMDKALNYILRQGKANFGEGGLGHDVIRIADKYGVVPLEVYPGLGKGDEILDHSELQAGLAAYVDAVVKNAHPTTHWNDAINGMLDAYMGKMPATFEYKGKTYTPLTFKQYLGIRAEDYISITSFTHHPYYISFILEIPDNYANGSYFNVKLDEMMKVINSALDKGSTVLWDGDVSEKGFSQRNGVAILPEAGVSVNNFASPEKEAPVDAENRQAGFMNYSTMDDHLMHIIGRARDQNGTVYYIVKNSWGEVGPYNGYIYISNSYMRMKTISVTVNKTTLPSDISSKIQ